MNNLEERRKAYVVAEEEDDIKCPFTTCAYGGGLAGNGRCEVCGDWKDKDCSYFISTEDYEQNGLIERIEERLDRAVKLTAIPSTDIRLKLMLIQADLTKLKELRG